MPWRDVLRSLKAAVGLLDGVVFSGGEPTLQPALLDAVHAARSLGFRIGLHTAGILPERFAPLLPWIDWVGFDVKAPFGAYSRSPTWNGVATKPLRAFACCWQAVFRVKFALHFTRPC